MEDEARRPWYQGLTRYHWTVLIIAALGWLFDTMDQNLFNLVRQSAVTSLLYPGVHDLVRAQVDHVAAASGNVTAIFLIGWAVGGLFFGIIGDRLGRTRTMMLTIAIYAIFTGLSGLTHSLFTFTLFRFLTALGVGASGPRARRSWRKPFRHDPGPERSAAFRQVPPWGICLRRL